MVIEEKALLRAMKAAYSGWGYTVTVTDRDVWVISTPAWIARICKQNNVPNEVLALIVLHMGYLPEAETAYRIFKSDTGPAIQEKIYSEAIDSIRTMETVRYDPEIKKPAVRKTKLHFGRCRVWQRPEDLQIFLVDPRYESMIAFQNNVHTVRTALCAAGEISSIYVFREHVEEEDQIEHLEQMQWVAR